MTVKDELHELVDQLDDSEAWELLEYARWVASDAEEPLSDEELARVREGQAAIARGDYVTLDELHQLLGPSSSPTSRRA